MFLAAVSKSTLKLKKKREAKKAKKEQAPDSPNSTQKQNQNHTSTTNHSTVTANNGVGDAEVTDDPEKMKKIRKIKVVSNLNEKFNGILSRVFVVCHK